LKKDLILKSFEMFDFYFLCAKKVAAIKTDVQDDLKEAFDEVDNVTKLRHNALLSLINSSTDDDLIELLHVGASRLRFWPLELSTLAPLVAALRTFYNERCNVADEQAAKKDWEKNPARRRAGSVDGSVYPIPSSATQDRDGSAGRDSIRASDNRLGLSPISVGEMFAREASGQINRHSAVLVSHSMSHSIPRHTMPAGAGRRRSLERPPRPSTGSHAAMVHSIPQRVHQIGMPHASSESDLARRKSSLSPAGLIAQAW
jgi:hypothetical protein